MADADDSRERKRAWQRAWIAANPHYHRDYKRAKAAANPEETSAKKRASRVKGREKVLAYKLKWNAENREKALEIQRRASRKWKTDNPFKNRFYQQKAKAGKRGIAWMLTLEEWTMLWMQSGKWKQRGVYVMARNGDTGPYALGNVRICTRVENDAEHGDLLRGKPRSENDRRAIIAGRHHRSSLAK